MSEARSDVGVRTPWHSAEVPWVIHGLWTGALGAAAVALFFLVVDLVKGRPLWTPGTLGSAVFLGETLAAGTTPPLVLVIGYTAIHGAVFVAIASIAAFLLETAERLPASSLGLGLGVTAGLFAACELIFLAFAASFAVPMAQLGTGPVAVANLLAAAVMTALLVQRARARGRGSA